ncbi:PaaX family transcriptional regulator C-terminal domain-containing protein [Pelotomaculum propionicicum]|uniref:PaaX family transcriptional regulator C-terminal domain-containing protein n=1 Tax=Pelotomaculum propionicicum TaxID=258475 RepID=UPI003B7C0F8F
MYLKVRRNEGITSILLFIFNAFLTEKQVDELPLKTILRILAPFNKNETAVRMGLSRGVQNGLLINFKKENEVYYRLTDQGRNALRYWWNTIRIFQQRAALQREEWNGKWNAVYFPAGAAEELALSLRKLGYGSVERHMWISPYDASGQVSALAAEIGMAESLYLFLGELAGGRRLAEIVTEMWPVEELNKKYKDYIAGLKHAVGELDTGPPRGGAVLPFLHKYGLQIFGIMQEDPQLPLQLLPPDWSGLQAVLLFMETRKQLLPEANAFIADTIDEKG